MTPMSSNCMSRESTQREFASVRFAGYQEEGSARRPGGVEARNRLTGDRTMTTALIVEDDSEQAKVVARFLRFRDFESTIVEDGKTGLGLARQYLPDVLLLDLKLPDVTGFEVCRQLR